jgi:hypothetical protein
MWKRLKDQYALTGVLHFGFGITAILLIVLVPAESFPPILSVVGVLAGLFIIGIWLHSFFSATAPEGTEAVAIVNGGDVADFGRPGKLTLPIWGDWQAIYYDPKPKILTFAVEMPTRDGTYLTADASLEWRPDRKNIGEYLERKEGIEKHIQQRAVAAIQTWSRGREWTEVFSNPAPPAFAAPGAVIEHVTLVNLDHSGDRAPLPPDRQKPIMELVADVTSVAQLESTRARLLESMPDQADFINAYCDQRKAAIMLGAIK